MHSVYGTRTNVHHRYTDLSDEQTEWLSIHDRLLFKRSIRGIVVPVLECCSVAQWCSAANTLNYTTGPCSQWCPFFIGGVFECNIVHRRSVQVLLYAV